MVILIHFMLKLVRVVYIQVHFKAFILVSNIFQARFIFKHLNSMAPYSMAHTGLVHDTFYKLNLTITINNYDMKTRKLILMTKQITKQ